MSIVEECSSIVDDGQPVSMKVVGNYRPRDKTPTWADVVMKNSYERKDVEYE